MEYISGKEIAKQIKDSLKEKVSVWKKKKQRVPKLAVLLVGNNPASQTYVRNKEKACQYVGMDFTLFAFTETITQQEIIKHIESLNDNPAIDGILVQLPLPSSMQEEYILSAIRPDKDVDGFHPSNVAALVLGHKGMVPGTPKGIMTMLETISYDLTGKEVVIVGRSNIVGKPLLQLCLQKNATVTIAHSKSEHLATICRKADVLITAIGKPRFFTREYVKKGAIVIDVGINRDSNNRLCGDVATEDMEGLAAAITPVPGGVGPMTIAMLLTNTMEAFMAREV